MSVSSAMAWHVSVSVETYDLLGHIANSPIQERRDKCQQLVEGTTTKAG